MNEDSKKVLHEYIKLKIPKDHPLYKYVQKQEEPFVQGFIDAFEAFNSGIEDKDE